MKNDLSKILTLASSGSAGQDDDYLTSVQLRQSYMFDSSVAGNVPFSHCFAQNYTLDWHCCLTLALI
jgi:hypothetical protein